jgi:hypothetical protein
MAILRVFPLFAIVLIIFNVMIATSDITATLDKELLTMTLISGAVWALKASELLIIIGVLTLYIEVFKATRTGSASVIDHTVSMVVFIIFLIEFISVAGAGNSTFLILSLLSLLDVVAGFTVTIVSARRDLAVGAVGGGDV